METFIRYFLILSLLKPYPRRMAAAEIMVALKNQGVDGRGLRTIQRDLDKLSAHFPLDGDRNRPRGWCWAKDAPHLLPGMDLHTALSFRLMQEFMQPLIPTACLSAAERHFSEADKVLRKESSGQHRAWLDKVQVISRGQPLVAPTIKQAVLDVVYEALFTDRRFCADYLRRSGDMLHSCTVNPLGLVFVNHTPYMVGTLWEYEDIKQMPLHRFMSAELLTQPVRGIAGFSLDRYVCELKEFDYPESDAKIRLVVSFNSQVAHHLTETPLAEDQEIQRGSDEEVTISATVHDTSQLRWWLLGFGDQVKVIEPKELQADMAHIATNMARSYGHGIS